MCKSFNKELNGILYNSGFRCLEDIILLKRSHITDLLHELSATKDFKLLYKYRIMRLWEDYNDPHNKN